MSSLRSRVLVMCLCALTSALCACGSGDAQDRDTRTTAAASPGGAGARAGSLPASAAAARAAAPTECARTAVATLAQVARRVYEQAATGEDVAEAVARVRRSAGLAGAVSSGRQGMAAADLRGLLLGQITRIEILRVGRVYASAGSGAAIAPVRGTLPGTDASFVLSVQGRGGYVQELRQLTGAQIELSRAPGTDAGGPPTRWVGGSTRVPPPASVPDSGATDYAGMAYEVDSFTGESFPRGRMRIALLLPGEDVSCERSVAAQRAAMLARVGERIYDEERSSPTVAATLRLLERTRSFIAAVAARSAVATRDAIVRFFEEHLHVVRVRVTVGGRQLVDVGGPHVLAPVRGTLRSRGRTVGEFEMAVQDDAGFLKLAHLFTGAQVLVRMGAQQVAGTLNPGPARVPGAGTVSYDGRSYEAYSFPAEAFPSGPLRVSLLIGA